MTVKSSQRILYSLLLLSALAACDGGEAPASQPVNRPRPAPGLTSGIEAAPVRESYSSWIMDFRREALAKGISPQIFDMAFAGVREPLTEVVERDHTQPEHVRTFAEYIKSAVKEQKVEAARAQWESHREILAQAEQAYGVQPQYLLALWQVESNFGTVQGRFNVVQSLATLAYDGRRSAFFRQQLMDALIILQQERMNPQAMLGSWAGAMGQTQFMPQSYLAYAVDFDGDGRRDIWTSDADALASMANYLHSKGWDHEAGWGMHVSVPEHADMQSWVTSKEKLSLNQWRRLGIRGYEGKKLPKGTMQARLVMPDGDPDSAYLVFPNYEVIMDWNHSNYFATSVGLLADAIAARP